MQENQFDVIILGTGLVESIIAAALSKAGYKVAHVDSNPYYGGNEASLSLEELVQWADKPPDPSLPFERITRSASVPSQSRQYSVCLKPAILPSAGSFISSLIASGVSKYSTFRSVDFITVYEHPGRFSNVPGSKEDIFKSKDITLIEKRRLMRFLTFTLEDFEGKPELEGRHDMPFIDFLKTTFMLSDKIASVLTSALAFCSSQFEPTLPVLQRVRKYLRSAGRFGAASPFLIGHYGCIGEIAQGFCRAAAVSGGVYILGREIKSISLAPTLDNASEPGNVDDKLTFKYNVEIADVPDTLQSNLLISSPLYVSDVLDPEAIQLPPSHEWFKPDYACIARCIIIIDQPLALPSSQEPDQQAVDPSSEEDQTVGQSQTPPPAGLSLDAGILVFPPSSVQGGSSTRSATVLINGEGSLSTPKGKWLAYIALPLDQIPDDSTSPEALLKPYLDTLLSFSIDPSKAPITPLFTTTYIENVPPPLSPPTNMPEGPKGKKTYLIPPPLPLTALPELVDIAANAAERTFVEAMEVLQSIRKIDEGEVGFWPPLPREEEDAEW